MSEADGAKHLAGFLDAGRLMTAPCRRIVVLHVTIIFGGFALLALGAPSGRSRCSSSSRRSSTCART